MALMWETFTSHPWFQQVPVSPLIFIKQLYRNIGPHSNTCTKESQGRYQYGAGAHPDLRCTGCTSTGQLKFICWLIWQGLPSNTQGNAPSVRKSIYHRKFFENRLSCATLCFPSFNRDMGVETQLKFLFTAQNTAFWEKWWIATSLRIKDPLRRGHKRRSPGPV